MSYTSLLINTCVIEEDTGAVADGYGHTIPIWTTVTGYDEVACRLVVGSGRELLVGAEVVVADYNLFLGDVIITERNRVTIDSIDYEILLVSDRQNGIANHHKECFLRTVR